MTTVTIRTSNNLMAHWWKYMLIDTSLYLQVSLKFKWGLNSTLENNIKSVADLVLTTPPLRAEKGRGGGSKYSFLNLFQYLPLIYSFCIFLFHEINYHMYTVHVFGQYLDQVTLEIMIIRFGYICCCCCCRCWMRATGILYPKSLSF